MANFIPISNFSGSTSLAAGELAFIGEGIIVASTSMTISGSSNNYIDNMGSIFSSLGVFFGSSSFLYNRASGTISGFNVGIDCLGSGSIVDNAGTIFGGGSGVEQESGSLTLINSGSITSGYQVNGGLKAAILILAPGALTLQNSGLVRAMLADSFAIRDGAGSVDTVTNSGSIIGKVALGGGADFFNTAAGKVAGVIDGGAGGDTIIGSALADTILGGTENDILTGNADNDGLTGGNGNDHLSGGFGRDTLTGGLNNDFFVFNTAPNTSANRDIVTDFSHVADTVQLENAVFTKLGAPGILKSAFLRLGTGAHDADDHIIYNHATGVLSYDVNGDAAGGVQQIALLQNKPVLTLGDFVVI
jgi:Ca2+-binding RTX toxin-like protein